jgi:cyclopropane fatty-acyl-phospholipid synthase-like methyltransferase
MAYPDTQPIRDLYAALAVDEAMVRERLDRSLDPRPPDAFYSLVAAMDLGPGKLLLDAGCRDGHHGCSIALRTGCSLVGVDIVSPPVLGARSVIAEHGLDGHVALVQGDVRALPLLSGSVDVVLSLDVVSHVTDVERLGAEMRRVLRAKGAAVVHASFETELLERAERGRLVRGLALAERSLSAPAVEAALEDAGLRIRHRDRVGSEWREWSEEHGDPVASGPLLRAARMVRDRDRLCAELGKERYERELALTLWRPYQMLGKLCPTVYVLDRA